MSEPVVQPLTEPGQDSRIEDMIYDRLALTLLAARHGVEASAATAARAARLAEEYRMSMLYLHAVVASMAGPLFWQYAAITGLPGASWRLLQPLPHAPEVMSLILIGGGITLAWANAGRWLKVAYAALLTILVWYVAIFVTFSYAVVMWLADGAHPPPTGQIPATYAIVIYGGWAAVIILHLRTLRRKIRRREAAAAPFQHDPDGDL